MKELQIRTPLLPLTPEKLAELKNIWTGYTKAEHAEMKKHWDAMQAINLEMLPERALGKAIIQRWHHFAAYCDARDRLPFGTNKRMFSSHNFHDQEQHGKGNDSH